MKLSSLDYNVLPFGGRSMSYLIEPRHVISLGDLALMIKTDCIYKIANGISSKNLPLYFHSKTNSDGEMIGYPLVFSHEFEMEYQWAKHRIYVLKRDVDAFLASDQSLLIADLVLKTPQERMPTAENINEISKAIISRACAIKASSSQSFLSFQLDLFRCGIANIFIMIKALLYLPKLLKMSFDEQEPYSKNHLLGYDGTTLSSLTKEHAQDYVSKVLTENNIAIKDLKKHTALRAKIALHLKELGLGYEDIGLLLHPNTKVNDIENLKRQVHRWFNQAKISAETEVSVEKSVSDKQGLFEDL